MNPFEFFAREHDETAVAIYDIKMNLLDCNRTFCETFLEKSKLPLTDLMAFMVNSDESLAQMLLVVEVEKSRGLCTMAYTAEGNRKEFRVRLNSIGEDADKKYICSFTDVTDCMFFQKVLMRKKDHLEKLDRISPVGVFNSSSGGSVLYVNSGLVAMLGYDNEYQVYNLELKDTWVNPADRDELLAILNKDRIVSGYETQWRKRDGTVFWVSLAATGQLDRSGNVSYIEVVVLNIESKKRTEKGHKQLQQHLHSIVNNKTAELQKSNEKILQEIAERQRAESLYEVLHSIAKETERTNSLHALLEFIHRELNKLVPTPNIYFAFFNKHTNRYYFPYSVDKGDCISSFITSEAMQGSLTEYVRTTGNPLLVDEKEFAKMLSAGKIKEVGPPCHQWMGIPLKDSQGVWGVLSVQSYDTKSLFSETDLVMLSGLADNISMAISRYRSELNRRKIQSLYNTVVDNLIQGVVMCDPEDVILFANRAFSGIMGIPAENLEGMNFADLIPEPDDVARAYRVREARRLGESSSYHISLKRSTGELIPVSINGIPRFEDGDYFIGTIGLIDLLDEAEVLLEGS
ncbi:hypothetical protein CSA37_07730 [Candidatus Fermentibacteria bacterium]|nr:MAG: hypothetical protein CSA37_07730 [Candidatus Fermentibacteria bacterium]